METTSLRKLRWVRAVSVGAVLAGGSVAGAVPLTNGGLLNSWETGDPLQAEGWYTPSWATYKFQEGTADWTASTDVATEGTKSLKLIWTPDSRGNFNWGARFESWSLGAFDSAARVAWEAPWREAITDNRDNYSLQWDVIWRTKGPGKDGIPQPPGWGANMSFAIDWGAPETSGGYSGWTQFNQLGFSNVTQDEVVTVKIPLKDLVGAGNALPIPADFHWIQLHFGPTGGWAAGEQVAAYFDNVRIVQDVVPLTGDTNDDGVVDLADLNNVLNNFGASGPSVGDENGDGTVDLADLNNVLNNFGASAPAAAGALSVVPEPGVGLGVVLVGAAAGLRRRRPA